MKKLLLGACILGAHIPAHAMEDQELSLKTLIPTIFDNIIPAAGAGLSIFSGYIAEKGFGVPGGRALGYIGALISIGATPDSSLDDE